MNSVSDFVKNHVALCVCTLGLAIVVYAIGRLGHRLVTWIREKCAQTQRVETLAQTVIQQGALPQRAPHNPRVEEVNAAPTPAVAVRPLPQRMIQRFPLDLNRFTREWVAPHLLGSSDAAFRNKGRLLELGIERLQRATQGQAPHIDMVSFASSAKYGIAALQSAPENSYLNEQFQPKDSFHLETTAQYYTYTESFSPPPLSFHIDFANRFLGGGVLRAGFVQEEIAFSEAVAATALVWQHQPIMTRDGEAGVLQGSPNPRLLRQVLRVQAIQGVYGAELFTRSQAQIEAAAHPLTSLQQVNFIAIAAPCLESNPSRERVFARETLLDIANTLFAGFELALAEANGAHCVIHSGPIGCGAFGNDREAVFLLHLLVAEHLGVNLVLHGYPDAETGPYIARWRTLSSTLQGRPLYECIQDLSQYLLQNATAQRPQRVI